MRAGSFADAPDAHEPDMGEAEISPEFKLLVWNLGEGQLGSSGLGNGP